MKSFLVFSLAVLGWGLQYEQVHAFSPAPSSKTFNPVQTLSDNTRKSPLFGKPDHDSEQAKRTFKFSQSRVMKRFNTLESVGLEDEALTAGVGDKIKSLHNPKTYLALSAMALLKWNGLGRNPLYWFATAFCVKWYRARYVFKIPVWDRQPNWNNIITSKEQEKDLKAFTCKNCGSTIFIAKTREFFFEGSTGIGGLGCFTCGVKGAENFIMDRDRIVEDVADVDDYFEYERPLDFVSRAERRKLMKEAQGDEEKANQILIERAESPDTPTAPELTTQEKPASDPEDDAPPAAPEKPKSPPSSPSPPSSGDDDDILDALDMDM